MKSHIDLIRQMVRELPALTRANVTDWLERLPLSVSVPLTRTIVQIDGEELQKIVGSEAASRIN